MTDQAKLEAALYAANETIRLKDARIAELEAENERLKIELGREGKIELKAVAEQLRGGVGSTSPCRHILCNHINGRTVCFACGAMWRDGRRYYEEDEEGGDA